MWAYNTGEYLEDRWRQQRIPNHTRVEYIVDGSLVEGRIMRHWMTQRYGQSYKVHGSDWRTIRWDDIQCVNYGWTHGYTYAVDEILYYSPIPIGTLVKINEFNECIRTTTPSGNEGTMPDGRTVEFRRHDIRRIMTYEYAVSKGLWSH